jgi:molecular chaperone GrpE (heat shock protein)
LNLKIGDFVKHSRLGIARVAEIGSDHLSIHPKGANTVRLGNAEALKELRLISPDGFYALIYNKEPDAKFLREKIEDVVVRIMRDRNTQTITLEDIKRELAPIVNRELKSWDSWWRGARKKLLAGSRVIADPQKKTRYLLRVSGTRERPLDQMLGHIQSVSGPSDLLAMAREIGAYPDSEKRLLGRGLAERILGGMGRFDTQSPEFSDLFCALLYALSSLEVSDATELVSRIPQLDDLALLTPGSLEGDLIAALAALMRISPTTGAELAKRLLSHPSMEVAAKSFTTLNTDANRQFLKSALLSWLQGSEANPKVRIELYIRSDFFKHLRQSDLHRLYLKLIEGSRFWEVPGVRQFLNSPDLSKLVFGGLDDRGKVSLLSSRALSTGVKSVLIESASEPENLLKTALASADRESEAAAALCLSELVASERLDCWKELLELVTGGNCLELFRALVEYVRRGIEDSYVPVLLTFLRWEFQLLAVAQEHYPDSEKDLLHSIEKASRKCFTHSKSDSLSPLQQVFLSELGRAKSELTSESKRLEQEKGALSDKLRETERERARLQGLAEMLKSSAAVERQELEAQVRAESLRPLLGLLDDLERPDTSDAGLSAQQVRSMVEAVLNRSGVRKVGTPGEISLFDPELHQFVEEPGELKSNPNVRVLRSGFQFETGRGPRLVRRALVRLSNAGGEK